MVICLLAVAALTAPGDGLARVRTSVLLAVQAIGHRSPDMDRRPTEITIVNLSMIEKVHLGENPGSLSIIPRGLALCTVAPHPFFLYDDVVGMPGCERPPATAADDHN